MVEGDKRTGGKRRKEGKRKRAAIERIEEGKGPGGGRCKVRNVGRLVE